MKKIVLIIALFCSFIGVSQVFDGWKSIGKTTGTIQAIPNDAGRFEYNSTTGTLWYNDGSTWVDLGSGGGGSGDVTAAAVFGTDNVLIKSDGVGKGVQSTGITVSDVDNVDLGGGMLQDIDQAEFNDADVDATSWDIREVTGAPYAGDLAFRANGGTFGAIPDDGVIDQSAHLVTKAYGDANYSAGGGLANVVEDVTPEFAADLDMNDNGFDNVNFSIFTNAANANQVSLLWDGTNQYFQLAPNAGDKLRFSFAANEWQIGGIKVVAGGLANVVEDVTPQLGGPLDMNSQTITGNFLPTTNDLYDLGSGAARWSNINMAGVLDITGHIYMTPTDTEPGTLEGFLYWDNSENTLKQYNGTSWEALNGGGGGLANVVEDVTPQLGGDLDMQGFDLLANFDAELYLDRTGGGTRAFRVFNGSDSQVFAVNEDGNLSFLGTMIMTPTDTEPTGTEGKLYFDDSENTLKQHNGTAWEAVGSGGGIGLGDNNTWTGINTFQTDATDASLQLGGVTSDPSGAGTGDMWLRTDTGMFTGHDGAATRDFVMDDKAQTLTNKTMTLGNNTISGTLAEFNIAITDGSIGTGNVTKVGTPVDDQIGIWTGDGTIEGNASLTLVGGNLIAANNIQAAAIQSTNPNNASANFQLQWSSDVPRIRIGGSGVGTANGFEIRGPADALLLDIDNSGNIAVSGTVDGIDIASWIDQDVSNGSAPVLDATNFTNLPSGTPEGTAVLSTGEVGGTKYLREDGDGTSSWQTVAGGGDVTKVGTPVDNQIGVWTGDGTIEGTSGLTYSGTSLGVTGDILLNGGGGQLQLQGLTSGQANIIVPAIAGTPDITLPTTDLDLADVLLSDVTGEPSGSDKIDNVVSLTQAEYDVGSPVAGTTYIITDGKETFRETIPITAEGADIAVADGVTSWFTPVAVTLTGVYAALKTAPTGSGATFDIEEDDGTPATILSTLLTIDATERSSLTATAAVISDSAIAAGSFLEFNIDVIGSTIAGATGFIVIEYTID